MLFIVWQATARTGFHPGIIQRRMSLGFQEGPGTLPLALSLPPSPSPLGCALARSTTALSHSPPPRLLAPLLPLSLPVTPPATLSSPVSLPSPLVIWCFGGVWVPPSLLSQFCCEAVTRLDRLSLRFNDRTAPGSRSLDPYVPVLHL